MEESYIALDFGSGQITAVLSIYDEDTGTSRVRYATRKHCPTVSACYILDFDKTVRAVGELLQEVSQYAPYSPTIVVGLRGEFLSFRRSDGSVSLNGQIITEQQVRAVLDDTLPKPLPEEIEVVNLLPQAFILDGKFGVKPEGLQGNWLEAISFVSCAPKSHLANLNRVMAAVGCEEFEGIPTILTLYETLLKPAEKQARTLLLDVGFQHSSALLCHKGIIEYAWELPFGAEYIIYEVANVLQNEFEEAHAILKNYTYGDDEILDDVLDEAANQLMRKIRSELVQSLTYIRYPLQQVILTGGGADMPLRNAAKQILGAHRVRLARHDDLSADSDDMLAPAYTSALSLALYSQQHGDPTPEISARRKPKGIFDRLLAKFGFN